MSVTAGLPYKPYVMNWGGRWTLKDEETRQHFGYLDGWRGVAIAAVLVGHFGGDKYIWGRLSSLGVDLFFVLSGRLMAEVLFVRLSPLRVFFVRRASRIYPALVVFVLIETMVFRSPDLSNGLAAVIVALTMTLNYAMVYSHPIGMLDHLWSLCVEEHAYVLLAMAAFLARRRVGTGRLAPLLIGAVGLAALISGVVRLDVLGESALKVRWRTDVSLAAIFLAAALWLAVQSRRVSPWAPLLLIVLAVGLRSVEPAYLAFGLSTLLLAGAAATLERSHDLLKEMLGAAPLRAVGVCSFSLYLWQQPFYKLYEYHGWSLASALTCAVACAILSYFIVERPCRRLLNKRFAALPKQA